MNRFVTRFIVAIAFLASGLTLERRALAVQRDPGGQGQVLIYPYYTVHQGQQTLLSIINASDAAQVMQVTFREALNGRSALQFKVWLGRWDVWTGTVFALADDGIASDGAGVLTRDPSCTTPMFSTGAIASNGARYFPLANENYSGAKSDGGPGELGRARHGWIEVISLATLYGPNAIAMAFLPSTGMPVNCVILQTVALDHTNSGRPSGGLSGAASVIRVDAGVVLSSRAEGLSGFTEISLYNNDPLQPAPDLSSVNEGTPGGAVSAMVVDELGRNQVLTYGAPASGSRPIDAVSAALMATRVKNENQTSQALAAATDWVVTLPTKPFYTDPMLIGIPSEALPPFDEPFRAPGSSRQCVPYSMFNQDQKGYPIAYTQCSIEPTQPLPIYPYSNPQIVGLFQAANVVAFLNVLVSPPSTGVLAAPKPPGTTNPYLGWHIFPSVGAAGWLDMNLAATNLNHRLPASAEGKELSGLPAIGYSASVIVNGNVSNGVLANYGSAVRHVTTVACSKASDGLPCD